MNRGTENETGLSEAAHLSQVVYRRYSHGGNSQLPGHILEQLLDLRSVRDGERVNYDPYALFLEGVRPTFNNPDPGKEALTVWLFGGSTMRGATDYDDRTIPSFLARIWNREEPRLPAAMVNCGEDGFNSLMETKYLQKLLIDNRALALIIFFDGANDCAYFAQHRTPDAHHGYERVRGLIENYHRSLFGLLKPLNAAMWSSYTHEFYDKFRQGVIRIDPGDPVLQQFVGGCEKRYDYVQKIAASFGAKFLLLWQPCWWAETNPWPRRSGSRRA